MKAEALRIDADRLLGRIDVLAQIGAIEGGGCCRLALSDEDKAGRDLICDWMRELGLAVCVDPVGNIFGLRTGSDTQAAPVMTGSHIDTVRTGGRYDGNLGVLDGLEVMQTLDGSARPRWCSYPASAVSATIPQSTLRRSISPPAQTCCCTL